MGMKMKDYMVGRGAFILGGGRNAKAVDDGS